MAGGGTATGAGTHAGVTLRLSQLQNLCKRDPEGYKSDFDLQIRRLESEVSLLLLQPSHEPPKSLVELLQFAAAVSSSSYKGAVAEKVANLLMNLLVGKPIQASPNKGAASATLTVEASIQSVSQLPASALHLHRDIRKSCVSALILMRNKGAVEPLQLLEPFFRIMATIPDKGLRTQLYKHIVNDVRNINKKGKQDEKVNRSILSFLHRVVSMHGLAEQSHTSEEAATDVAAKRATDMVCELYRRRVWTDDRAVAVVATAAQSMNLNVMCRAMRFFLGIEEKMAEDDKREQEDEWNGVARINYHSFSKKTKAHNRHIGKQVKNRTKKQRRKEEEDWTDITPEQDGGVEICKKLFPAMEILRDPQGLAEAVFKRLKSSGSIKYDVKLLMINFVTRLVGNHELMLLPLYSFLQKYMGGQQRDVTAILAYTVQACHEYAPPDEVYGILKTIAHNFITERCSEEQMAVGINAVRAICARVPTTLSAEESSESSGSAAMDIEAFARDLAAFSNHRDRSVSIAGKSWTNFIRVTAPGLLQGKDRGMAGTALLKAGTKPMRYGERKVATGVEGADLLVAYEAKKAARDEAEDGDNSAEEDELEEDGAGELPESDDEDDDEGKAVAEDDDSEADIDNEASDDEAPTLVNMGQDEAATIDDVSKMSPEERDLLKQKITSTRIFTTKDFEKMRKLVDRENRAKRDPREAARRRRAEARGQDYDAMSDDSDEDEPVRIAGAVNPEDIMAMSKKKRQNKAEKLESILAGRSKFETKRRDGGSTNVEKKRQKNFLMTKYSFETRKKGKGKGSLSKKRPINTQMNHDAKKRRRKAV
jgi:protein SDA1